MNSIATVEMTESCARDLTNQINSAAEGLAGMLQRAHDGKAWSALGYASWKDYVRAELKMSERRSFQLLDFAEIRDQLNNCSVVPTTEAVTRELKRVEPSKRRETYSSAVEKAGGKEPTAKQVREAAVEVLLPEPSEPEQEAKPVNFVVDHGLMYANLAILQLKKIDPSDKNRQEGLDQVLTWVFENYSPKQHKGTKGVKLPNGLRYVPALGLEIAGNAICILETITKGDSQRREAVEKIITHCLKMLKESR